MAQSINWVPPSNENVGSILIYRADSNSLDALGSRTIINTIGAKDNDGNWVTTYSDTGGNIDSTYRIQFWDGVGSSVISDPISFYNQEQLADYDSVKRLARLDNSFDLGSDIVYDAIEDASLDVFDAYGDPVSKTSFFLDSETGVSGRAYDFTGNMKPVYQVRHVYVEDNNDLLTISNLDYEVDFNQGVIKFTDEFIGSWDNHYIYVHYVPKAVNNLAEHLAALNLHQGELIIRGANVTSPEIENLQRRIDHIKEGFRPKAAISAQQLTGRTVNGYKVIPQQLKRSHLFFS